MFRVPPPGHSLQSMKHAILVVNAGSSSIKFGVYAVPALEVLCRGKISNIGTCAEIVVEGVLGNRLSGAETLPGKGDHDELTRWLFAKIEKGLDEFELIVAGHRVVHGGTLYDRPLRLTPEIITTLEGFSSLVPNHQPHNLGGISHAAKTWPDIAQVACFDTAFHRSQPRVAQVFALPQALTDEGIMRYGFHGLSYEYVAHVLPQFIGDDADGKVIVAHLGHGASMCAMIGRRSMGSTMGFTALDGLVMGTRCGNLDPGVVLHLLQNKRMTVGEVRDLLSNRSGLLGVSGISDDIRELLSSNLPSASEAIDLFIYRTIQEMGALFATIGGLDTLVFTGGIGENSSEIRRRIVHLLAWCGAHLDSDANGANDIVINSAQSKPRILVIPANEEYVIARATLNLLEI